MNEEERSLYQWNKYHYLFLSKSVCEIFIYFCMFLFIQHKDNDLISILRYGPLYMQYRFSVECSNIAHFLKIAIYTITVHQRDLQRIIVQLYEYNTFTHWHVFIFFFLQSLHISIPQIFYNLSIIFTAYHYIFILKIYFFYFNFFQKLKLRSIHDDNFFFIVYRYRIRNYKFCFVSHCFKLTF